MKFSFIIGTLNRTKELEYCLQSLLNQKYKNYEIIIVDQSSNDLTEKMISTFNSDAIIYRRVDFKGLSKARNFALNLATGDYICLTDDDAFYHDDYLVILKECYDRIGYRIISGYMWNAINDKSFIDYSKMKERVPLSVRKIIRNCPSPAISFPRSLVETIGGFDENFGVGAKLGAGEETDFLLRAYWSGCKTYYCKNGRVDHPHEKATITIDDKSEKKKACSYSVGIGALYKKHFLLGYKKYILIPYLEQKYKMILKIIIRYRYSKEMYLKFKEGFNRYDNKGN